MPFLSQSTLLVNISSLLMQHIPGFSVVLPSGWLCSCVSASCYNKMAANYYLNKVCERWCHMFPVEYLQNGLSLKGTRSLTFGIRFAPQTVKNVLVQRIVVPLCECLCCYYVNAGHTIKGTDAEVTRFCNHYDSRQISSCLV